MTEQWPDGTRGLVRLPSGRRVRGRALRRPLPDGPPPQLGVYLLGREPEPTPWPQLWVRWPDLRLPRDVEQARAALAEALQRSGSERVEVACAGGKGRTGTAIAWLAVLDGVPPGEAVTWTRAHYDPRAIETLWQTRFVRRLGAD